MAMQGFNPQYLFMITFFVKGLSQDKSANLRTDKMSLLKFINIKLWDQN